MLEPGAARQEPSHSQTDGAPLLAVSNLRLAFGGVLALDDVSLDVSPGEIFAIIGPNGAGKTSLLNTISGLYKPQHGTVLLHGPDGGAAPATNLLRLPPHRIARLGVARTFQNIELFRHMSVLQNVMLGRHVHMRGGVLSGALYWGRQQREEIQHREVVEEILDFLEIESIRHRRVGALAYGLQKRVELARALALAPRLLLLDEPMAGMNVEEKEDMARFILDCNEMRGITVVLIEHDMGVVMDLSDRIAVLDFGKRIALGPPQQIRNHPDVLEAYLGTEQAPREQRSGA